MDKKGVISGILAYLIWGFFPLYFKAIHDVPPLQILFHRVVWSFVFLTLILVVRKDWTAWRKKVTDRRTLTIYSLAAVLLASNWLVYIYGVNTGQVIETSLGYFINPLVTVALGVVFLRERLRLWQWVPVGMAAAGVIYLTAQYGRLPWIALALALTFAIYGLIKKVSPLGSLDSLSLESTVLFLPSLAYLILVEGQGAGFFGHNGWATSILLILAGPITAIPLLFFATAARRIPLWLVGILQYIAPTGQFLLGVLVFREPFSREQMFGFGLIWAALFVFTMEGFLSRRREETAVLTVPANEIGD